MVEPVNKRFHVLFDILKKHGDASVTRFLYRHGNAVAMAMDRCTFAADLFIAVGGVELEVLRDSHAVASNGSGTPANSNASARSVHDPHLPHGLSPPT